MFVGGQNRMVFEKRGVARIKANAMASESISDYAGFVKSGSATESLDDAAVDIRVQEDMKYYVSEEVASVIQDAKIFFNDDPALAYQELKQLLDDPEVETKIVSILTKSFAHGKPSEGFTNEENERIAVYSRIEDLRRRAMASEALTQELRRVTMESYEQAKNRYPDQFAEKEPPRWEVSEEERTELAAKKNERLTKMKKRLGVE